MYKKSRFNTCLSCINILNWPCTCLCLISTSVILAVTSNQAFLRHTKVPAYRCFLPNLTGFTGFRCVRPGFHWYLQKADLTKNKPATGVQPCYSGLQVQGTATSPLSTTKYLNLLKTYFNIILKTSQHINIIVHKGKIYMYNCFIGRKKALIL